MNKSIIKTVLPTSLQLQAIMPSPWKALIYQEDAKIKQLKIKWQKQQKFPIDLSRSRYERSAHKLLLVSLHHIKYFLQQKISQTTEGRPQIKFNFTKIIWEGTQNCANSKTNEFEAARQV